MWQIEYTAHSPYFAYIFSGRWMTVKVNEMVRKYNGIGTLCKNVQEYNTLMRYLISIINFAHFQWPSVSENMTLQEFLSAKKASDDRTIVLISDHKTHATGPAQVALDADHYTLFDLYAKRSVISEDFRWGVIFEGTMNIEIDTRYVDGDSEIWQTPQTWLEVDDNQVLWAIKNRHWCGVNYLEKNNPVGGKKWDMYKVTSLYFPEVYITSYEKAEKLCREVQERPVTDEEERDRLLWNAVLSFSVRHALGERNASQLSTSSH